MAPASVWKRTSSSARAFSTGSSPTDTWNTATIIVLRWSGTTYQNQTEEKWSPTCVRAREDENQNNHDHNEYYVNNQEDKKAKILIESTEKISFATNMSYWPSKRTTVWYKQDWKKMIIIIKFSNNNKKKMRIIVKKALTSSNERNYCNCPYFKSNYYNNLIFSNSNDHTMSRRIRFSFIKNHDLLSISMSKILIKMMTRLRKQRFIL